MKRWQPLTLFAWVPCSITTTHCHNTLLQCFGYSQNQICTATAQSIITQDSTSYRMGIHIIVLRETFESAARP